MHKDQYRAAVCVYGHVDVELQFAACRSSEVDLGSGWESLVLVYRA